MIKNFLSIKPCWFKKCLSCYLCALMLFFITPLDKFIEYLKSENNILPNGCTPAGHKFSPYHMCTICGEYK